MSRKPKRPAAARSPRLKPTLSRLARDAVEAVRTVDAEVAAGRVPEHVDVDKLRTLVRSSALGYARILADLNHYPDPLTQEPTNGTP